MILLDKAQKNFMGGGIWSGDLCAIIRQRNILDQI